MLLGLLFLYSHSYSVNRGSVGHLTISSHNMVLEESLVDARVDEVASGDISTKVEVAGKAVSTAAGGRRHTERE